MLNKPQHKLEYYHNQNAANIDNNLQINLSQAIDPSDINEKSILMKYFHSLI